MQILEARYAQCYKHVVFLLKDKVLKKAESPDAINCAAAVPAGANFRRGSGDFGSGRKVKMDKKNDEENEK